MSRLIDADKLMKDIEEITKTDMMKMLVERWILKQPTAFDVDKVIEQLEEKSITFETDFTVKENKWNLTNDAIDIVKAGGIDVEI